MSILSRTGRNTGQALGKTRAMPSNKKQTGPKTSPMDITQHAAADHHPTRRRTCTTCNRPATVCLCHVLPPSPLKTAARIVILHHPHERRHKLATVPVLAKCLENCEIVVGRRLKYGDSKLLDALHDRASENPDLPLAPALFLFPGPDALPIDEINQGNSSLYDDGNVDGHVLIAFDGTWKHAKEMMLASSQFLSKFSIQVCLKFDKCVDGGSIFDSELILRKEPFGGCMSTMEAVARCLRVLEPHGIEIESRMVEVLRAMVDFQTRFLTPMKPRPKLKKAEGKEES